MLGAGSGFFIEHITMGMLFWYAQTLFNTCACLLCINGERQLPLTVALLQFGHAQHFEHELHQEGHHEATEGH